jgi:predicted transcriptional regulator
MTVEITEEIKKKICQLISTPGNDIEEIAKKVNLDYDTVKEILSEEYYKCNLEYGRRLCCRG